MQRFAGWSWRTPVAVVSLAMWLLAVPLVLAATLGSAPQRAPATGRVAHARALPGCTIIGTQGDETLVGTSGDDVICALGGDDVLAATSRADAQPNASAISS